MAGLLYDPSRVYVVFLGVIYIDRNSKQYTSVIPTANTADLLGSIALLVLIVYHRVQTTEYARVLTDHQLFFEYMR